VPEGTSLSRAVEHAYLTGQLALAILIRLA
jgi:hypothetical protein